jgi:hypothetical protein
MSVKTSFKTKLTIIFAIIFTVISVFIIENKYFSSKNNSILDANIAVLEATDDEQIEENGSNIIFETATADLGKIPLGENRIFYFKFINKYDEPVLILNVTTACGCTEAEWEQQPILPDKESAIKIIFTAKETGLFSKKISVLSNRYKKDIQLIIKGEIFRSE